MTSVRKIDYFAGVFLSVILSSAKKVPALFDETDAAKTVEFMTNTNNYRVYVKYSTKKRSATVRGKSKVSWDVNFTPNEYSRFSGFKKPDYKNFLAIVCTDKEFKETEIVVLEYEKAMRCLSRTAEKGSRRITVSRHGSERSFRCQGVGMKGDTCETCPYDFSEQFN